MENNRKQLRLSFTEKKQVIHDFESGNASKAELGKSTESSQDRPLGQFSSKKKKIWHQYQVEKY